MTERHRALVTAPFRGPGLDTLRAIADVVLDPWIDHQPLRLYNADAAGRAGRGRGRRPPDRRVRLGEGPVFDLPLVAIGSCRGDPTNVDIAGRDREAASPCCARPGATPTRSRR